MGSFEEALVVSAANGRLPLGCNSAVLRSAAPAISEAAASLRAWIWVYGDSA